jgi:hypothetical protein
MIILCDTSSILLLLRIAPDMFINPVYECVTIHEVIREIIATPKFKNKYPWRTEYRGKLQPLPNSKYRTTAYENAKKAIGLLLDNGVINAKTQKMIGLSEEDQAVAACAIIHGYIITTGDNNLIAFLRQEFKSNFKGNWTALEIVNFWLEKKIISWDDAKHALVGEWRQMEEVAQPQEAKKRFTLITGRSYPGS